MFQQLISSGPLTIFYLALLLLSLVFGLLSLIGGTAAEIDMDADVDEIDFLNISPFGMAMFGVMFGAAGLVTHFILGMDAEPSFLWALVLGALVGASVQGLFLLVMLPRKKKPPVVPTTVVGRSAVTLTPLSAENPGQIEFGPINGRVTLPARATTSETIVAGEMVTIESVVEGVAVVAISDDPHSVV